MQIRLLWLKRVLNTVIFRVVKSTNTYRVTDLYTNISIKIKCARTMQMKRLPYQKESQCPIHSDNARIGHSSRKNMRNSRDISSYL